MITNSLAAFQTGAGQMGNGMGPGGWGFGFGFVGLAVMLLFVGTVGYLLVRAVSGGGGTRTEAGRATGRRDGAPRQTTASAGDEDPALAELRERYARGEIDDEEFERRAQRLQNEGDPVQ